MLKNEIVPQMLTIKEVAKKINLAPYFIRQLVLQNKVKFVRSGTKFFINFQSLLDYLNTGEAAIMEQNDNEIRKIGRRYNAWIRAQL